MDTQHHHETSRRVGPLPHPHPHLPHDLLHIVFSFLSLGDMCKAARTCRNWWNGACKKQPGRSDRLVITRRFDVEAARRSPFARYVTHVQNDRTRVVSNKYTESDVWNGSSNSAEELEKMCVFPSLHTYVGTFHFDANQPRYTWTFPASLTDLRLYIPADMNQHRYLRVATDTRMQAFAALRHIRRFHLTGSETYRKRSDHYPWPFSSWTKLEDLSVRTVLYLNENGLNASILGAMPSLRRFSQDDGKWFLSELEAFVSASPGHKTALEFLDLKRTRLTIDYLAFLQTAFPCLTALEPESMELSVLQTLMVALPRLHTLRISLFDSDHTHVDCLVGVDFRRITTLAIANEHGFAVTNAFLETHFAQLTSLSLRNCALEDVRDLSLPELVYLRIDPSCVSPLPVWIMCNLKCSQMTRMPKLATLK